MIATSHKAPAFVSPPGSRLASLVLLALSSLPAAQESIANDQHGASPSLLIPIACIVGTNCFIQNYVDHGQPPIWQDYTCGHLTYPGHHGTDFRLRNLDEMDRGIEVIAAAPGVIIGLRDGEPDVSVRTRGPKDIAGREGGNGVVIDHGNGWRTQYGHMRRGSIRVHVGQVVAARDVLGLVGLSGNTEFPHLDLEVWHLGTLVDPFAPNLQVGCGRHTATLWAPVAARALRYQASGVLNSVVTGGISGFRMMTPAYHPSSFEPFSESSPASIYFAELFGLNAGDEVVMTLKGPNGTERSTSRQAVSADKAYWQVILTAARPPTGWPLGQYVGTVKLFRGGKVVASANTIQTLP